MSAAPMMERFFGLSVDMLCVASPEGCFLAVSPACTSILGWSEQELLAQPYVEFVHPEDRQATTSETERLARGETTVSFENRYACKLGGHKWIQWTASLDPTTGVIYAVARDITTQKLLQLDIERQLREISSIQTDLSASERSAEATPASIQTITERLKRVRVDLQTIRVGLVAPTSPVTA